MKLKELCFFEELPYGCGESIHNVKDRGNLENSDEIVSYLNSGVVCATSFGLINDVFSGAVIGPQSMMTDGKWIWGSDLSTYVEKYNIAIPTEFVDDVMLWDGQPFEVDLSAIEA